MSHKQMSHNARFHVHTSTHTNQKSPEFMPSNPFSGDFITVGISNATCSAVVFYYHWISTAHPPHHSTSYLLFLPKATLHLPAFSKQVESGLFCLFVSLLREQWSEEVGDSLKTLIRSFRRLVKSQFPVSHTNCLICHH